MEIAYYAISAIALAGIWLLLSMAIGDFLLLVFLSIILGFYLIRKAGKAGEENRKE